MKIVNLDKSWHLKEFNSKEEYYIYIKGAQDFQDALISDIMFLEIIPDIDSLVKIIEKIEPLDAE